VQSTANLFNLTGVEMKEIKIKVFGDSGHAWARFPKARLVKLGIADKITPYSYQNGVNAFLEEDCDLSTLMATLKDQGYTVKFDESFTNKSSKIRGYCSYQA
jgi:hypothetical protein